MSELKNIINDIKIHPESFNFDEMNKEIKEIQFKMYCKQVVFRNISQWIKNNPHHTFPKNEKKWINTIRSHTNLICVKYECDVKELLLSIKNNKTIPEYMEGLSYYVYDIIQYDPTNCSFLSKNNKFVIVYGNEYEAYKNLFDYGLLYKNLPYPRIHIRKYSSINNNSNKLNLKRKLDDDNCNKDVICNTKRKYVLAKPIFSY